MALVSLQVPSPDKRNKSTGLRHFSRSPNKMASKLRSKPLYRPICPNSRHKATLSTFTLKVNDVFDTDNPVKSSPNLFFIGMMASNLAIKVMPGEELIVRTLPSKDLFELTIPQREEEKQEDEHCKGPKYYWQRARLIGADVTAEADGDEQSSCCRLLQHQCPSAAGVSSGGHKRFRQWQFHGRYIKHDIVEHEPFSKGLETMLTLATETGGTTTISTDANPFKSSLVYL
ncbi:hypothetical protein DER46DRAFT_642545 [Fusarium sp. MPI-SDFR-AT-0072]|nr:hypothetical protein DER46DRAFT_642545 [Fusarium sp. MPI-SDFR-AT-0072]